MNHSELIKTAETVTSDTSWFRDSSESIFNRLDRLQEVISDMRTAASDPNVYQTDLERYASLITQIEEEKSQLEKVASNYVDFDAEEYLQNLPGGTIASQYRLSTAGTTDLGEDDGSLLFRTAHSIEKEYRDADWINFVTAGAEFWTEDQSSRLLDDSLATREAAIYFVEQKTLPILDVTKRASIIDNFVTNVEICRRAKLQKISSSVESSNKRLRIANTLKQSSIDESFGDSLNWF